jgi:ABC-type multidrug transport system permease subunit
MKSVHNSLNIFGIYLILIPGLGLIFFPEFILDLFQLRYGEELWMIRIVGLLALIIGTYYLYFAKFRLSQLYKITVVMRYVAALFLAGLWMLGEAEITILLFAAIDAAGATWTMLALKNNQFSPEQK